MWSSINKSHGAQNANQHQQSQAKNTASPAVPNICGSGGPIIKTDHVRNAGISYEQTYD